MLLYQPARVCRAVCGMWAQGLGRRSAHWLGGMYVRRCELHECAGHSLPVTAVAHLVRTLVALHISFATRTRRQTCFPALRRRSAALQLLGRTSIRTPRADSRCTRAFARPPRPRFALARLSRCALAGHADRASHAGKTATGCRASGLVSRMGRRRKRWCGPI